MDELADILLVDDQSANLDALEVVLNSPAYRLVRAQSADEALLALLHTEFAAVVLDIKMPGISGLELAQLIKQRKRTQHVPILFLTAHLGDEQDVLRGYGVGAVDYLSKPINIEILRSKVAVFVDLFRKTRALTRANAALENEIAERQKVQVALHQANQELEMRVQERTADLTRLNQALRENAERLRLAVTGAGLATWDIDVATGNAIWSETLFQMLGYEPTASGEATFEMWRARVHSEDVDRVLAAIDRARVQNELFADEHRIVRASDGQLVWLMQLGRFMYDDAGHATRFIGVGLDNTLRRNYEDALRDADRRKDEFLAMLAHELRNPLSPIMSALAIVRTPRCADTTKTEALAAIERQVSNMTRIIDDLLDVSRITRGKVTLKRRPIDVAVVVANAIETSRPLTEAKRHAITRSLPATPLSIEADATRIEQILGNLITNAAKYTEPGGHIWVTAYNEGAEVVMRVRDNGIGIPADKLIHIFELFHQVDTSMDRSRGGLGIGLTLVRKLVELHGGTVTAASRGVGQGSEFVVRLPVVAPVPLEAAPRSAEPLGLRAAGPLRILVVDDAQDSRELLKLVLELDGHEAVTARDGHEAMARFQSFEPQVVVLDIGLPGMNGFQVARQMRAERGADVLLIAATGYGDEATRSQAREAGFDEHLVKPIQQADLTAVLARAHLLTAQRAELGDQPQGGS